MIEKILELEGFAPMSGNQWQRTNRFKMVNIKRDYHTLVCSKIGKGPYRKIVDGKQIPKDVRKAMARKIKSEWPERYKVFAEVIVRRPRRFDNDNQTTGFKPFWDAVCLAGWMVQDSPKWFACHYKDQLIGDPKTVIAIWVPQSKDEEARLEAEYKAGRPL